ncbi:MAG: DHH family phosphoesterase [Anaerostipes sp.]|jgi:phosphoesterase RecJ-like protein|nr:bifunctional oligoribonuclease/PAP phosphatase NrnA [Anaerostipes sp.]
MKNFISAIEKAQTIAITGHIHPDGDCIGSCLGLRQYILDHYNEKKVDVYLESVPPEFNFLSGADQVLFESSKESYDLFFLLDCSSLDRIEPFSAMFETAKKTFCIDHHISNDGLGDTQIVRPTASATCEVLYELFENNKITLDCAYCLYTGIVHDTGVFKHSNTSKNTMIYAGNLIEKGIDTSMVIDHTFYQKTLIQNKLLGQALLQSKTYHKGHVITSYISQDDMKKFGAKTSDTNGIIDQLRITEGVEVAIFIYDLGDDTYKFSMRSNGANVAKIAQKFGGGGHIRAAGFSTKDNYEDVLNNILKDL